MSWFAGYFNPHKILDRKYKPEQEFDYKFCTDNIRIWSDKTNTNIKQSNKNLEILCGTILKKVEDKWEISDETWLSEEERDNRNGHFICLRYKDEQLEFYNDHYGLRELYYYKDDDKTIYFSTRVDILLRWKTNNQIDWKNFGSYWLIRDPLGNSYFIKGIKRLNQAGKLLITKKAIKKTNVKWTAPEETNYNDNNIWEIESILHSLIAAPQNSNRIAICALSGGYDSRVILALMLANNIKFEAVTWGKNIHPDMQIAVMIAKDTKIEHTKLTRDLLQSIDNWQEFYNYCGRSQLVNAGTSIFELFHYRELNKEMVLIDGGAGELIRRSLNANLEYRGKRALYSGNLKKMLSFMSANRADIFNEELLDQMKTGIELVAEQVYSEMPDIKKTGISNWLDIWNIRQRIGNISSRSQQILDDIITNFMPYMQREILDKSMKIPGKIRAKNHIHNVIISMNAPVLKNYPIVRNGLKMPFNTGRISGKLRAILFRKWSYKTNTISCFLNQHSDRIRELIEEAKKYHSFIYSKTKLEKLSEDYFTKGIRENEMVWWLTFEVFRRQFNIEN